MGVSTDEQETIINILRNEDRASVFTSDRMMMTKLDRCVEQSEEWCLEDTVYLDGELISKTYSCPKNFVSFRKIKTKRNMTEEQRRAASEHMRAIRRKASADENL